MRLYITINSLFYFFGSGNLEPFAFCNAIDSSCLCSLTECSCVSLNLCSWYQEVEKNLIKICSF